MLTCDNRWIFIKRKLRSRASDTMRDEKHRWEQAQGREE